MAATDPIDMEWFRKQVAAFEEVRPLYGQLRDRLEEMLGPAVWAIAPTAIVTARVKGIPSFAQKILRKRNKYHDPVRQLTDLCGARVITHLRSDVDRTCSWIREHFLIDEANSLDQRSRLGASEFGYRSVHYVVQLKPESSPNQLVRSAAADSLFPLKAEIQVRTMSQHTWADVAHDRIYKSSFAVPDRWTRELARVAAMLETVDDSLEQLVQGVSTYQASFDRYRDEAQMREELELLLAVQRYDPRSAELAHRIARLRICLQDWQGVVSGIESFPEPRPASLSTCLGYALCQLKQQNRRSDAYRRGRQSLEQAIASDPDQVEAYTRLAETWIGEDDAKVLALYQRAFEVDSSDPEALCGYARFKIAAEKSLSFVALMRPILEAAVDRCRAQAEVGMNLPWSLYRAAELLLLLRKPFQSVETYAEASAHSPSEFMIDEAEQGVKLLGAVREALPEVEWVRRFLLLARAARFHPSHLEVDGQIAALATPGAPPINGPVIIVAGGCDPAWQHQLEGYRDLLRRSLAAYRGTIISGGTQEGVSGLVGEIAQTRAGELKAIGYLPEYLPAEATRDSRYSELRKTPGAGFNPLQPLQGWIDLFASGNAPGQVRLLGINGGEIASFEYRLALSLGADVGILRDSGGEAGRLQSQADREPVAGLSLLPPDLSTVSWFLQRGSSSPLEKSQREQLGQAIHERYRANQRSRFVTSDPVMGDWEDLSDSFRESSAQQADHLGAKLAVIGMQAVPVSGREIRLKELTPQQVEILAEMEHGRWNVERLRDGWTLGPRDPAAKKSPYLVSWAELPENAREWDRQAVRAIPGLLKEIGLEIQDVDR